MAPAVKNLFESKTESYFDANVTSVGVMLSISEVLVKYNCFIILNHGIIIPRFLLIKTGKRLSEIRF